MQAAKLAHILYKENQWSKTTYAYLTVCRYFRLYVTIFLLAFLCLTAGIVFVDDESAGSGTERRRSDREQHDEVKHLFLLFAIISFRFLKKI